MEIKRIRNALVNGTDQRAPSAPGLIDLKCTLLVWHKNKHSEHTPLSIRHHSLLHLYYYTYDIVVFQKHKWNEEVACAQTLKPSEATL